jgi:hypothetical protein
MTPTRSGAEKPSEAIKAASAVCLWQEDGNLSRNHITIPSEASKDNVVGQFFKLNLRLPSICYFS